MAPECICQICTCGRHRCPHTKNVIMPKDWGPCFFTENNAEYTSKSVEPRHAIRPDDTYRRGSGAMEDVTSYMKEYTPKKGDGVIKRAPIAYVAPTQRMNDATTYLTDYPEKDILLTDSFRPRLAYIPPTGRMMDETMSQWSYKYPDPTGAKPPAAYQKENLQTGGDFNGNTTFRNDYIDYGLTKKRSYILQKDEGIGNKGPMDGQTMYTNDYSWKQCPERFVMEKRQYIPPHGVMAGNTTHRDDYIEWQNYNRALPILQKQELARSDDPFSTTTTTGDAYQPWGALPKMDMPWAERGKYVPPSDAFWTNTSYNDDYIGYPDVRNALILPKVGEAPYGNARDKMYDRTTYIEDYPEKKVSRMKCYRPDRSYRPTEGELPESTNKAAFKGLYNAPARLICPPHKRGTEWAYGDEFYKDTSYNVDYVGSKFKRCPAIKFVEHPSRYSAVRQAHGHVFYDPSIRSDEDLFSTVNGGKRNMDETYTVEADARRKN